jgi:hypothetical protein
LSNYEDSTCKVNKNSDANITIDCSSKSYLFSSQTSGSHTYCLYAENDTNKLKECKTITVENFIPITNCVELQNMQNNLTANYRLMNNIDCSDTVNWNNRSGFLPVGNGATYETMFKGNLDGQDFNIYNFYINYPDQSEVGLIGWGYDSSVKNIGFINANITGKGFVGTIYGFQEAENVATLENIIITGYIKGEGNVGGVVGKFSSVQVDNVSSNISIEGINNVGGLIGSANSGVINNSLSKGNIKGNNNIGGLIGQNYFSASILNSFSQSDVNGNENVGGLAGYFQGDERGKIKNSYFLGTVKGIKSIGGLAGFFEGAEMINSFAVGIINGETYKGGIIGLYCFNGWACDIENSYYDSTIYGSIDPLWEGEPRTTSEMTSVPRPSGVYEGWDFDNVWSQINGQYPKLRWQD